MFTGYCLSFPLEYTFHKSRNICFITSVITDAQIVPGDAQIVPGVSWHTVSAH